MTPETPPHANMPCAPVVEPPGTNDRLIAVPPQGSPGPGRAVGVLGILIFFAGIGAAALYDLPYLETGLFGSADTTRSVVRRIIQVESNGCATATNDRSSAAGPAQFIEETWLRLIRKHRPDLAGKPRSEILHMRRDPYLSREMAARFAEQNARTLRKNGFPITSGTLYLSHFSGVAGAMAILSAPETADAARTMARADATGRVTREQIVNANPFLEDFAISDLKKWAERKMRQEPGRPPKRSC